MRAIGSPSPTIHIVDDDASFRAAIGDLLCACDYRVALYESAISLLEQPPLDEPACILLDVQMAGLSGPQVQDQLSHQGSTIPIVFVTGHGDIPTTVQAIKAGAEDVLTKPVSAAQLVEAIEAALARGEEARRRNSRLAVLRSQLARLTTRERAVFTLLARGRLHKQIAYELGTTERTVKFHRHNVLQKFGVRSLADLAVIAERLGLLSAPGEFDVIYRSQVPAGPAEEFERSIRG
jgi:FixJ family two-component response regulator